METFYRDPRVKIPPGRVEPTAGASLALGAVTNSAKPTMLRTVPAASAKAV
jgi:hypothetical protein